MENNLNFSSLFPDLEQLVFPPATTEALSSLFIVSLWCISAAFLVYSLFAMGRSLRKVGWLVKQLEPVTSNNVSEFRETIIESAEKRKDTIGHQWQEFDETLIEVKTEQGVQLFNTFDAAYFFNTHTLAGGVTENRMIAAVPGFLTAIGVIGTFMGLQLGLADLNISGNVDVNQMKDGVAGVINGAKVAFMTSVWGVALSVLFNFSEKGIEQFIRRRIGQLQSKIDNIFPRLSAEAQLQRIANDSHESRESLQGLAEKIGEKMQESLVHATQGIQDGLEASLNKIMAPAINKLVEETSDGNQKALESVLTSFMDGFGQQGEQQRAAMDKASQNVNDTLENMGRAMEAFVNKMEVAQDASSQREQELISNISVQVSELVEQGNEQKRMLTDFVQSQLTNMSDEFEKREQAASKREQKLASSIESTIAQLVEDISSQSKVLSDFSNTQISGLTSTFEEREKRTEQMEKERNEIFVAQTEAMKSGTEQMMEQIQVNLESHNSASTQILDQGRLLQTSIDSSVTASNRSSESMLESAKELKNAAGDMKVFGSHIRDAGNKLAGAVTQAVESTKDLAQQNQSSSEKMESLRTSLIDDTAKFKELAEYIRDMLDQVDDSFAALQSSQKEFLQGQKSNLSELTSEMKKNVQELSSHMTDLLADYSEQANTQTKDHLNVWSNSTTQYATQMNNAVKALSSVVDEIETKVAG